MNWDKLTKARRSIALAHRMGEGVRRTGEGRDHLSRERRSWNMSRIRGKDTTPERVVRSLLHRLGYRFRLHVRTPAAAVCGRHGLKEKISTLKIKPLCESCAPADFDAGPRKNLSASR